MKSLLFKIFILLFISFYLSGCDNSTGPKVVVVGSGGNNFNNPPTVPANPNPADNAVNTSNLVILGWSCSDPDAGDTVRYDIYLDPDNPPTNRIVSDYLPTTYGFGIVEHGITLYWKIVAHDTKGASTSGPVWTFRTAP